MNRNKILIEDDSPLKNIEIEYPFCFKTKKNTYGDVTYYRYLEDGRYEMIKIQELQIHFSFGNHSNTIYDLCSDNDFYFKQLQNKHELITSAEFDEQRDVLFKRYNDYLEGLKYIASEVQQMIAESPESQRKEFLEDKGIIENGEENGTAF